jgi:hypothetical protein
LRDAESAEALHGPSLRATDPSDISYEDFSVARDIAEGERVTYSRRALLFAAFAAEGYANDFLYERCVGKDRDALAVDAPALLSEHGVRGDSPIEGALPEPCLDIHHPGAQHFTRGEDPPQFLDAGGTRAGAGPVR